MQVSSTETGVICGNIVFEGSGYSDRNVVVLNDIHIDIMDYISPATCPDVAVSAAAGEEARGRTVWVGMQLLIEHQLLSGRKAVTTMPSDPLLHPTRCTRLCLAVPQHVGRVRVGEQGGHQHQHHRG